MLPANRCYLAILEYKRDPWRKVGKSVTIQEAFGAAALVTNFDTHSPLFQGRHRVLLLLVQYEFNISYSAPDFVIFISPLILRPGSIPNIPSS
jgi:hypothetical protein